MEPTQKKRVLIADDHAILAEGLASILSSEYDVVGISRNGRQLLSDAVRLKPDLVVLDVSMPELNGIDAANQLRTIEPTAKVVFVTQQVDPQYLRAAFRAGASGYVAKQSASEELKTALRQAIAGTPFVTPTLRKAVDYAPISELRAGIGGSRKLTARQREVLQLIAEGRTARQISAALNISTKTVEFHKKALMDQTGLRTAVELTRYAIANGIVSL